MSWQPDFSALAFSSTNQGVEELAKDDVLYYGTGTTIAGLADDRSQYNDDQATGASWHYEAAPASRFDVSQSWSIECDIDASSGTTGRLFSYAASTNFFFGLRIGNSAGLIDCIITIAGVGTVVGSLTLPDVSGSRQNYIVGWSAEPNKATTGASDAVRSVLYAFNVDTGTYAQSVFTHADRASGTGVQVWWAFNAAGASPFDGTPNACRFSTGRVRTPTETREDFIGRTTAPTLTSDYSVSYPIVDVACDIAEPGQFAGPVYAEGAATAASHALRLFSPLANRTTPELDIFDDDDDALFPTQWHSEMDTPPGESVDHEIGANLMWRCPLPPACTHVRVRVRMTQTLSGGADTISLRAYSMNRPPSAAHILDHANSFQEQHVTGTHASAGSAWVTFDDLQVVRNSAGETWISIGIGGTRVAGVDDLLIQAVTIEPLIA